MNQKNTGGNNVQIRHAGAGNVFNVAQGGDPGSHIQLQIDPESVRKFDKDALRRDRWTGRFKKAFAFISISIGFAADAYGLSDKLSFSVLWIFVPVTALLLVWSFQHMESWRILRGIPEKKEDAGFIGHNEVVEEGDTGRVFVYSRRAACIYPDCSGTIVLHPAPPKEVARLGRNFVGVCSVCGRDHSYRLDYLWNAYPEQFDWRPPENEKRA